MAVFQIIMSQRDGKWVKTMSPVTSEEQHRAILSLPGQQHNLELARKGKSVKLSNGRDVPAKQLLTQFNFSCMPNADGTLAGSTVMSNTIGADFDFDLKKPGDKAKLQVFPAILIEQKNKLGLLFVERSVSKGYHIVCRRKEGMSQLENLNYLSRILGVRYDDRAKDITRVFFGTSPNDWIYVDNALYDATPWTEPAAPAAVSPSKAPASAPAPAASPSSSSAQAAPATAVRLSTTDPVLTVLTDNYDGVPLDRLVDALVEEHGARPRKGNRNDYTYRLARDLRYFVNNNADEVERRLPLLCETPEEQQTTIRSACRDTLDTVLPTSARKALDRARRHMADEGIPEKAYFMAPEPPQPPQHLPRLMQILSSCVPDYLKPMVLTATFPALATYLHNVQLRYTDNTLHFPGFLSLQIAPQSSGKGCINEPIRRILGIIQQRDEENRAIEAQWKADCKELGSNKKKPARPGIFVQVVMPNITNAALVQRLADAQQAGNYPVYTKTDELELLMQLGGGGSYGTSTLLRNAFDGATYGQDRVGMDSVTATPQLHLNLNASTTPAIAARVLRGASQNGTLSRLNISTIIPPSDRSRIPRFGIYDAKFDALLKPYLDRLDQATGIIQCRQANALAERLAQQNNEIAVLSGDSCFEAQSYRAIVIAWRKAMVLYIANGMRWSKDFEPFITWSMQYDLWCKMRFFGEQMKQEMKALAAPVNFGPRNQLDLLSDEFTYDQFLDMRRSQGKTGNPLEQLRKWMTRGYIAPAKGANTYAKTEDYLVRHKIKRF